MGIATTIAIIASAIAVDQTIKSGKAQKRAAQAQVKSQQTQARRQRRAAIRQNILATARSRADAESAGTAQSSGLTGAVGSGRSQLGSELGFGSQISGLNSQISMFQTEAQTASALAGVGFQVAGLSAGFAGKSFNKKPEVAKTPAKSYKSYSDFNPSPLSGVY
tara:strand:- start:507 stop:998 length:492 start_codon:yes stop_codon:yes gene_type:complete